MLRIRLLLAILMFVFAMSTSSRYVWARDNRPIVVLREDDCQSSWRVPFNGLGGVSALAYGKSKQIPITWGIITNVTSSGSALSWAELADYLSVAGGEPASHSVSHRALNTIQEYIDELVNSRNIINANLPNYSCTTFLQPGPWSGEAYLDSFSKLDNPIGQAIQANYQQSMAYLGQGWITGNVHYRYGLTNTASIDYRNGYSLPHILAMLDIVAESPGLIYVISCHGVQEAGGTAGYAVPADALKAIMDKLSDLRDQGRVRLMSLSQAYANQFDDDINLVVDPGFELSSIKPGNTYGPWMGSGSSTIVPGVGVGGSRCASVPDGFSSVYMSGNLVMPGQYKMEWSQKVMPGKPINKPLMVSATNYSGQTSWAPLSYYYSYNTSPDVFETNHAFLLVKDRLPFLSASFKPYSGGGYLVDNVSIKKMTIDPYYMVSDVTYTVTPTNLKIRWRTPDDPEVSQVKIVWASSYFARHPSEAPNLFCTVSASHGVYQEYTRTMNWSATNSMLISCFALKASGDYTAPTLLYVRKVTNPAAPSITVLAPLPQFYTADASWTTSDPDSMIWGYEYQVGRRPLSGDVVGWTATGLNKSVRLKRLPAGEDLYLSVRSQNVFGYYGYGYSAPFQVSPTGVVQSLKAADETDIAVTGNVTAVFADCVYIQDNVHGLKITNCGPFQIGDRVTIEGRIRTHNGERYVDASGH